MDRYDSLSNIELQSLIHFRNDKAFRALYDRYWTKIFTICNNRVQDAVVAQDLVQDIFLSLWLHKDLSSVVNLEAYLYQATKYAVFKYLHRSSRFESVDEKILGRLDRAEEYDISEVLDSRLLEDLLYEEVERLPEKAKLIFNYSRKDNLNSKEIAEKLNISHRTVENQLSITMKKLRTFLKNLNSFNIF